jgi:phosphoglycolate phosphatase
MAAEPGVEAAAAPVRAVLFDLDGTLADTAPDLAFALNAVLREHGRPALPLATIRPWASHGAQTLLRHGFGIEPGAPGFEALRARLLAVYREHLAVDTSLFPGMAELLARLEHRGIGWGVVTNKPSWLTEPLLAALGLSQRAACIVSGDTAARSKPHPEPFWHACRSAGLRCAETLCVGDARRDIEAGHRAGLRTLVALFGYLHPADEPATWGADGMVEQPLQILDWIARWDPDGAG